MTYVTHVTHVTSDVTHVTSDVTHVTHFTHVAHAAQDFRKGRMVDLPKRTAKFQFIFGSLLVLSVLVPPVPMLRLSRLFFSPP